MTSKLLLILLASTFISGSLEAKMIGETSALMSEAEITTKKINSISSLFVRVNQIYISNILNIYL